MAAPSAKQPTAAVLPGVIRSAVASGEALGLRLESDTLLFCDRRGGRALDLISGTETAREGRCANLPEVRNIDCGGIQYVTSVRAPEHNDIIDTLGKSIPMNGRLKDCAFDNGVLLVATWDEVVAIDVKTDRHDKKGKEGGNQVAINSSWMAWSDGAKVFAQRR